MNVKSGYKIYIHFLSEYKLCCSSSNNNIAGTIPEDCVCNSYFLLRIFFDYFLFVFYCLPPHQPSLKIVYVIITILLLKMISVKNVPNIISTTIISLPFHPPTMVRSGDPYLESLTGLILKRIPVRLVIRSARS